MDNLYSKMMNTVIYWPIRMLHYDSYISNKVHCIKMHYNVGNHIYHEKLTTKSGI